MHLGRKQAQQIIHPPPGALELRLALEVIEHVAVDDSRIDPAQVEKVVDVVEGPARDDRQDAHVVAVVEHTRQLRSEQQRCAFDASGGEPHRPGVDALLLHMIRVRTLNVTHGTLIHRRPGYIPGASRALRLGIDRRCNEDQDQTDHDLQNIFHLNYSMRATERFPREPRRACYGLM